MEVKPKNKVLIVEDDAVIAELYRRKLEREGYDVSIARDGLEALTQLPLVKPDLVLLDLMMPKFNGVDVLKFIRADKHLKATKVVVFTNAYMTNLAMEASKAGPDRSLLKSSTTPARLLSVIRELIQEAGQSGPGAQKANRPPSTTTDQPDDLAAREFLEKGAAPLTAINDLFESFAKSVENPAQPSHLAAFQRQVNSLAASAATAGFPQISNLSNAVDLLLLQLQQRPQNITPTTVPTIQAAVQLLRDLFDLSRSAGKEPPAAPFRLLLVDEDSVCTHALSQAFARTNIKSATSNNPFQAFELVKSNPFDLILLDYFMPGMDGIEFYSRLQRLPDYVRTPVIFITSATDFHQRGQHILQEGDEVIIKPFIPLEVALKVLTVLLNNRLVPRIDSF